jgi:type III pantothenate kinase
VAAGIPLLDLGNQRLKLGRTTGPGVVELLASVQHSQWQDGEDKAWLLEQLQRFPEPAWLCSTRPEVAAKWLADEQLATRIREVKKDHIPLQVQTTGTGMDRLLASLAAWKRVRGAVLVADMGTAWTLDATTAEGKFLGGAIGPGLGTQERALADACPHLGAPAEEPCSGIPATTPDAVAEGSRTSLALALDALSWAYEQDLPGGARRFLCGGDARLLIPWMSADWAYADHLVLEGMSWLDHAS